MILQTSANEANNIANKRSTNVILTENVLIKKCKMAGDSYKWYNNNLSNPTHHIKIPLVPLGI